MRRVAVALSVLCVVMGGVAWAEEAALAPEEALRQAAELMRAGHCDTAIPLLQQARSLRNALWNMAECSADLGRPGQALEAYRAYLEHPGTQGRTRDIAAARAAIARLEPQVAQVTIRSNVASASVSVDGMALGTAPLVTHLGRGLHAVEVSSPGYAPWRREIQVEPPADQPPLDATLDVVPGTLVVASEPAGAEVVLDGDAVLGQTPFEGEVAGGGHLVEVRLDGYRTAQRRAMVPFGQRTTVEVALAAVQGTLAVATDVAEATLEVDGEARGASPFPPLSLSPGRHSLHVAARRNASWDGQVDVIDSRTTAVEVELSSSTGVNPAWFGFMFTSTLVLAASAIVGIAAGAIDSGRFTLNQQRIAEGGANARRIAEMQAQGTEIADLARGELTAGLVLLGATALALVGTAILGTRTQFRRHRSSAEVRVMGDEAPQAAEEAAP